jgi:hypothetical protein
MDAQQKPEVEEPKRNPAALAVVGVLAVVALAAALYVTVRSLRRVQTSPVPIALRTAPPDTGLVVFRASMRRKVRTLETRCKLKRKRLKNGLNPQQDSLSRECDSAIALILIHVTALDSVKREDRKMAAGSLRAEYARVKGKVNAFTRSGLGRGEVSDDSLDAELKKLIGE